MYACQTKKNIEVVKLLLDKNVDVNNKTTHGNTALMFACLSRNYEIIKLLIDKNADVNAKTTKPAEGFTALIHASQTCEVEIVKLLIDNNANVNDGVCSPLYYAIKRGKLDIVKLLLDKNANVNNVDKHGSTALSWATTCGRHKIIALLLPLQIMEEREIPEGETDCIMLIPIKKDALMVDFHNEFFFKRYYRAEDIKKFKGENPTTREPIVQEMYYKVK